MTDDDREPSADERREMTAAIRASASYRHAREDAEFLAVDELRPVRIQLEFLKPERSLRQHHAVSTVVVFGSARTLPPAEARRQLEQLETRRAEGRMEGGEYGGSLPWSHRRQPPPRPARRLRSFLQEARKDQPRRHRTCQGRRLGGRGGGGREEVLRRAADGGVGGASRNHPGRKRIAIVRDGSKRFRGRSE